MLKQVDANLFPLLIHNTVLFQDAAQLKPGESFSLPEFNHFSKPHKRQRLSPATNTSRHGLSRAQFLCQSFFDADSRQTSQLSIMKMGGCVERF
jgi:hypothetical protein